MTGLVVSAQEFSSTNYTVSNPVIFPGGYSTSTNFGLSAVISQMSTGTSSASSFKLFGGFLYFPFVSTPVLSATPGTNQISLTWTSADAEVGWVVGDYAVGLSSTSGSGYTYTSAGNVLSYNATSLTAGTTYYFILKVKDVFGNTIATTTEVSAIPTAPSNNGGGGGSGGGGSSGGSYTPPSSGGGSVNLSGRAYPRSTITVLKDAQIISSVQADADANFKTLVTNLTAGNFIFSVYSEDNDGNRSSLLTFPVSVTNGAVTNIGGIFIAPTIAIDKSQVKKGDNLAIFGQTSVQSDVMIQVNSDQQIFAKTKSDTNGAYLYNFDSSPLDYGNHSTKSKSSFADEISSYSVAVPFVVGTQNILQTLTPKKCTNGSTGDANGDCKINLVDYSVVAYWYKRANPPKNVDLNGDGKVTLIDFSILAYHWTG